jgi:squalene-hopene/tetraprenyl-beta-curcumene cyclase
MKSCNCRPPGSIPAAALLAVYVTAVFAWLTVERPCRGAPAANEIEAAQLKAARFLVNGQGKEGVWRSDTYGAFKDGTVLTGLVIVALGSLRSVPDVETARHRGQMFLARLVQADGAITCGPHGLSYPVYTSSVAVTALNGTAYRLQQEAWLAFLRKRQLTEALGWQPADKPYGGWGYSSDLPRKPLPGELTPPLVESNLSATVFALDALCAAGRRPDDPAFKKALVFVERCQNYCEDPRESDPTLDDGGFFFIYDDAVRNKAGVAGKDRQGRERFLSYGSTTADGLRALLACGLPLEHPRVRAVREWLQKNFRADAPAGKYAANRQSSRAAVYYYYCASVAQALKAARAKAGSAANWQTKLTKELLARQQANGSWTNSLVNFREDDPILATAFALIALSACRN